MSAKKGIAQQICASQCCSDGSSILTNICLILEGHMLPYPDMNNTVWVVCCFGNI